MKQQLILRIQCFQEHHFTLGVAFILQILQIGK